MHRLGLWIVLYFQNTILKSYFKVIVFVAVLMVSSSQYGQHSSRLHAEVDAVGNTIRVTQDLVYFNQSSDTLRSIVLNDWISAYSDKNTLLARRFSDEFVRNFQLAKESERGGTSNISVVDSAGSTLSWNRPERQTDLVEVILNDLILPGQKATFRLSYVVKVPSAAFTKYGYGASGEMNLKNWFLSPARFEDHAFVKYSNANLDDIANGVSDYELELKVPAGLAVSSDLNKVTDKGGAFVFEGKNRLDFSLFIEPKTSFYSYKNDLVEVITNLHESKLDEFQRAIVVDRIVTYVDVLLFL